MNFSVVKTPCPLLIGADGKAGQDNLLNFNVGFSTIEEKGDAEGYDFEILIAKEASEDFSDKNNWKKADAYSVRKVWQVYRLKVPYSSLPGVGATAGFTVDLVWWRDCGRSVGKGGDDPEYTAYLVWEGGKKKADDEFANADPIGLKLAVGIGDGLKLECTDSCHDNGADKGYAHHQKINVQHQNRPGMYGVVQWVRGVFMRWKDLDNYQYLQVPSCGYNVHGHLAQYVQDGSTGKGLPNFFIAATGQGLDKPGDSDSSKKEWAEYTHELMVLQFHTQVFLTCDVNGAVSCDVGGGTDCKGKAFSQHENIKFRGVDALVDNEIKHSTLTPLDSDDWKAGIFQIKPEHGTHGGKGRAVTVVEGVVVCPELASEIPSFVKDIVRTAFTAEAGSTDVKAL